MFKQKLNTRVQVTYQTEMLTLELLLRQYKSQNGKVVGSNPTPVIDLCFFSQDSEKY